MAIFTGIATAIFAGTALAGTFAVTATAFALQAAAGYGISLLAKKIAGKKTEPQQQASSPSPGFSIQGRLSSGGAIGRSFPLGWRCTAGSLVYANVWGAADETPNAYLTQVIAVSDLPVTGLAGFWVGSEKCQFEADPHPDFGYPVSSYRVDGADYLWIKFYDGTQTEADPFLVGTVSSGERPYESTRVGTGIAYAIATARVKDSLFSGLPQFKFELYSTKLYDISRDSSQGGSGSQRWDNPATWGGDGDYLPAVQIYNILRGITHNSTWFYGLQGMSGARLPAANWISAIEKCRAAVDGPDGPENQYRSSLECFIGSEIAETIEQLLTACQGRLVEIGGVYKLYCGAIDAPVMSFSDDEIISTDEQSFTPFFGLSETINGISATYPEPGQAWNKQVAPQINRPALENEAGGRRLMADVPLDAVPYARQVQQLMLEALQEAQRARRHTLVLPPQYWPLEPGDIVEWSSARNGYINKQFRVDGIVDRTNLDVLVDLTEVDPSDYDFDFDSDFRGRNDGALVVVRPPAQPIVDFDANPYIIRDSLGIPRRPGIILSWEGAIIDDIVGVNYEVRLASTDELVTTGRFDDAAAGSGIVSQSLLADTAYEARGRLIPGSARETLWSAWIPVTTPDVTLSIEDFNEALQSLLRGELRQIRSELQASNDLLAQLIAEQDAANAEDKESVRTNLIKVKGNVTAAYKKAIDLAVGPESAIAQVIESVSAKVDEVEANVQVRFVAGVLPAGALGRWDLTATAQSALAGMTLIAFDDGVGGAFGQVYFEADRFYIKGPSSNVIPFIVDTSYNPPRVYLNGDIIAPGTITAAMIRAGAIEAIHIAAGSITSDKIAANSITADKLVAGKITAREIESDSLMRMNFYPGQLGFSGVSTPSEAAIGGDILNIWLPTKPGKMMIQWMARGTRSYFQVGSVISEGLGIGDGDGNMPTADLIFYINGGEIGRKTARSVSDWFSMFNVSYGLVTGAGAINISVRAQRNGRSVSSGSAGMAYGIEAFTQASVIESFIVS